MRTGEAASTVALKSLMSIWMLVKAKARKLNGSLNPSSVEPLGARFLRQVKTRRTRTFMSSRASHMIHRANYLRDFDSWQFRQLFCQSISISHFPLTSQNPCTRRPVRWWEILENSIQQRQLIAHAPINYRNKESLKICKP